MRAWPDAPAVRAGLDRAWRRLQLLAAMRGVTGGLIVATVLLLLGWRSGWHGRTTATAMLVAVVLGGARAWARQRQDEASTARAVEERAPQCRNVVITAAQILRRDEPVRDDIGARICRDAAAALGQLDLSKLFPVGPALGGLLAAFVATSLLFAWSLRTPLPRSTEARVDPAAASIDHVDVRLTPPAYASKAPETLRDPASLAVLAGTRVDLTVAGAATSMRLDVGTDVVNLTRNAGGMFTGGFVAVSDGLFSIQPAAADAHAGARTVIGLTVIPDRAPVVRITAPGRDLLVAPGPRRLDVTIDAADDLALDTLRLEYTRVSGSGESFEFKRGQVPVSIVKTSDREWRGSASWLLDPLNLQPGDLVVYRGVASDRRPGADPVESDAFIVEIASPGSVAAEGFAMDDQKDRYALSQRMVLLKTERLIARRATMPADDVSEEALGIAAEQRAVRAEFIFMMGGELEGLTSDGPDINEEAEAAGEADLLAGRARNRGRIDLMTATRRMSEAAVALTTADLASALPAEKAALDALQRAFAKDRYLLRAFATREQPDATRRMTGTLKDTAVDRRAAEAPPADARIGTLRRALIRVTALASRSSLGRDQAAEATAAADAVLRLDPAAQRMREIATALNAAASAMTTGAATAARSSLSAAASALTGALDAALPDSPAPLPDGAAARLRGAVTDAQQKRGGR